MKELFEKTGKAIINLSNDVEKLEDKFGKNTVWVLSKRQDMEIVADFYDEVGDKINFHQKMIALLGAENRALKVMAYKTEMNLPWVKALNISGHKDPNRIAQLLDTLENDLNERLNIEKETL